MTLPLLGAGPSASFSPERISGLKLWLDASSLGALHGHGDPVPTWPDVSGQGNDATQGTGANRPTFNIASIPSPSVLANGVDQFMRLAAGAMTALLAGDKTVFVACQFLALTTDSRIVTVANAGASARFVLRTAGASPTWLLTYTTGAAATNLNSSVAATTGTVLLGCRQSGTAIDIAVNGTVAATANDAGTEAAGSSALFASSSGAAAFANAHLYEMLAYDQALSVGDRADVTAYLKARWGIA